MNNSCFCHIHNHTEFSSFDGLNKVSEFPMLAREMGFKALGITDHGNIAGTLKFFKECTKTHDSDGNILPYDPITPILGCEFYLSKNRHARSKSEQPDGRKGNRHILLLSKNFTGYRNLCTLSEISWTEGFYGDPRIDFDLLEKYHEGLMCSSACLSSVINSNLLHGRYDIAKKVATRLKDIFGEDFYLEVMFHGIDAERYIIPDIFKLGSDLGIKCIGTNDCHYAKKEDGKSQEILMCMSTSRCIKDTNRLKFPYHEFYLKNADEMYSVFKGYEYALHNTNEIYQKVNIDDLKINFGGMRLPKFPLPNGFSDPYDYLKFLAFEGLNRCNLQNSEKHIARLNMELNDVKIAKDSNNYDFATYFLIVRDYINFAKDNSIMTGCGRGSGFGSLLLKCLGITYGVDPLEHDLLWERFLGFDSKKFVKMSDFYE
jgi:DNA polymerase-3 subunit alpha